MWKKQSTWIILIGILLFGALAGAIALRVFGGGSVARITLDGEEIRRIDLSRVTEPYEFDVTSPEGVNRVRVESGKISVIYADCPDGICVAHGAIEKSGSPIVCLPHRLVIEILRESGDGAPDAEIGAPHE
ncbi:MAG: NusG domain II-containing protein [Clostridia bacterium]|nr:NusG domain II-containing protein [Clostridia bacterium]